MDTSWMRPNWMRPAGRALRGIRAGMHGLASERAWIARAPGCIRVSSPAFGHGTDLPVRFTADGAALSPPLAWEGVPDGAGSLVLLIEDPDVPFVVPLAHGLLYAMPPSLASLNEGAIPSALPGVSPEGFRCGRNSFGRQGWLPPAPPPGHGPHHYAFQVFALRGNPRFEHPPGRRAVLEQMRGQVLGRGLAFGVYERA